MRDQREIQKERIRRIAEELRPGCEVRFQDHGPFIWFEIWFAGVSLVASEDREPEFFAAKTDDQIRDYLRALGGNQRL